MVALSTKVDARVLDLLREISIRTRAPQAAIVRDILTLDALLDWEADHHRVERSTRLLSEHDE